MQVLANSTKMCYTYNNLNRVVTRTIKNLSDDSVVLTEMFVYDSAGNITFSFGNSYVYDTNNRLIEFNGNSIMYDPDGNMLSDGLEDFTYDSSNRLIVAKGHSYTYNAENVRIRNLCEEEETTYTYDTNCKLSKLLCKTTNGVTTKYVYGRGLIGEETNNVFKTYHFDNRGSTVAITNFDGGITDTFTYDTYGKCISRTGTSSVIFGYNGRDGVVTDSNGLIYMRARYYAPYMKRFVNADIIAGDISNAVTLNRFAYANGNPVMYIDPFGLMSQEALYKKLTRDEKRTNTTFVPPITERISKADYARLCRENQIHEKNSQKAKKYCTAVLVADTREGVGLPVVGHSQVYFLDEYGNWYLTEFAGNFPDKSTAHIVWKENTIPEVYDVQNNTFIHKEGIEYVVLNGDFDKSVFLAKLYHQFQNFGDYHFLYNNCSHYADEILEKSSITANYSQINIEDRNISIPIFRVWDLAYQHSKDC